MLRDALGGERAILRQLIKAVTPVIQARVAHALLRTSQLSGRPLRQELEDFTQEVLVALFKNQGSALLAWDPERGLRFERFVELLTEREIISILRSGRRNPFRERPTPEDELADFVDNPRPDAGPGSTPGPTPEQALGSKEVLRDVLGRLLEGLTPIGARMFELLFVEECAVEEICRQAQMSADAVYAWRSRLLKKARAIHASVVSEGGVSPRKKQENDGEERQPPGRAG